MAVSDFVDEGREGLMLRVAVQPNARRLEVVGVVDGYLKIKLTAPPVDGKANALLRRFLAKQLGLARSRVAIVQGETARRKQVRLVDTELGDVRPALQKLCKE